MCDYSIGYAGNAEFSYSEMTPAVVMEEFQKIEKLKLDKKLREEEKRREKELRKERDLLNTFTNDNDTRLSKTMERLRLKLNKRKQ